MKRNTFEYEGLNKDQLPLRALARFALSLPPVWLILASFMAFTDVRLPSPGMQYLFIVTWFAFPISIFTLILSFIEWICPDGNAGPFLLHLAAAIIVLIEISHLLS